MITPRCAYLFPSKVICNSNTKITKSVTNTVFVSCTAWFKLYFYFFFFLSLSFFLLLFKYSCPSSAKITYIFFIKIKNRTKNANEHFKNTHQPRAVLAQPAPCCHLPVHTSCCCFEWTPILSTSVA